MSTQFPGKIDDATSLAISIDNTTPVKSEVVNDLRGAIIAIEAALGTRPGAGYGTAKNRMDAIEIIIASLQLSGGIFVAGGDLSGTTVSQTVIGLRGNPVSNVDPSDGYILGWNAFDGEWQPTPPSVGGLVSVNLASSDVYGLLPLAKQFAPSGTGIVKVSSGAWVSAGGTVVLSGSEVSGVLPLVKEASPTGTGLAKVVSGTWSAGATTLVNADVSSSAAIDYSKLGLSAQSIGAQQFTSTVDSYGTMVDVQPKSTQTTNATPAILDSFTISSNKVLIISAAITAIKSDNTQGATYLRTAAFRNTAGTVSQIGTTQDGATFEDDVSWDATIDYSTTTVRIMATGKAATTIRWSCVSSRLEVIA